MQNSGQYGVSDAPQYVVGRQAAPPHIFSISHDNMSQLATSPAAAAAHALHAQQQQHHLPHHLQAQQQHHHYGPHPGHQPHSSLQQIHQSQAHAPHSHQHPQFPLPQHPAPQQQAQAQVQAQAQAQQQSAQDVHQQQAQQQREQQAQQQRDQEHQLAQQQAAAQQAMVQQLGLGGPDSPELPSPGVHHASPTSQQYNTNQQQQPQQQQQQQQQQLVVVSAAAQAQAQEDDGLEEEGRSTGGNRWPRQETLALIKIRSEMDANFRDSGLKGPLWEEVSRKLAEQGYSRTAKKCKEKFENVHKYYKKTRDGKAGRQDGKSYRFFSQLEALYSGGQEAASMQLAGSRIAASAAASLQLTDTAAAARLLTGSKAGEYNGLQQRQSEVISTGVTVSESMSEDDYDVVEPERSRGDGDVQLEKSSSRKRKRVEVVGSGTGKAKMDFFSGLMKNLMEKQESMQQTFLEFMERREQDRQARDEAWRRQEMARVARDHELRVQEQQLAATRDAALVAFLQKVTGQTLSLPQLPTPRPAPDSAPTPPPHHKLTVSPPHYPVTTLATPTSQTQLLVATTTTTTTTPTADNIDPDRDSPVDPNSKRWPKPEVLTLIKLRSDMEPRFQEPGPKAPLWEEISQGMACLGFNRNQKRCKEKWENINKYFRKTKESNKKRPENAKTCPYFHQLELLYMKGVLGTPHNKQLVQAKLTAAAAATPAAVPGSSPDDEKVDHHAVLPLAQRTDPPPPNSDSEILFKMLPAAADAVQNAAANSGNGSGHLFSSPENGSSADPKASEAST